MMSHGLNDLIRLVKRPRERRGAVHVPRKA